jgi:hypothetical protein
VVLIIEHCPDRRAWWRLRQVIDREAAHC